MYGGVGVGKTMLMDLLVDAAPSEFKVCCTPICELGCTHTQCMFISAQRNCERQACAVPASLAWLDTGDGTIPDDFVLHACCPLLCVLQ